MVVGNLEIVMSQLIESLDPVSMEPSDDSGKFAQITANGVHRVSLIVQPLHEIVQQ